MCPAREAPLCSTVRLQTRGMAMPRRNHQPALMRLLLLLLAHISSAEDNTPRHGLPSVPAAAEQLKTKTRQEFHRCGTQSPSKAWQYQHLHSLQRQQQQGEQQQLRQLLSQPSGGGDATVPRRRAKALRVTSSDTQQQLHAYTIPTYVHVVVVTDPGIATGNVTTQAIADQLALMNSAYSSNAARAGVSWDFQLLNVTYTTTTSDSDLCKPESEGQLKQQLREGGKNALNLYVTDLSACGVLGFSTWPWDITKKENGLAMDGVVVHYDTLPGGDYAMYNLGGTAAHETGHWLGLFHTFENGCVPPGDHVQDTPYCTVPDDVHCPEHRDSCPQPGEDPLDNWMGYAVDSCVKTLTVGQQKRIEQVWKRYRAVA